MESWIESSRCRRLRSAAQPSSRSGCSDTSTTARRRAAPFASARKKYRNKLRSLRATPIRSALARLAILPDYKERDDLGTLHQEKSAEFNEDRLDLLRAYEELEAELSEEP